MLTVTGTDQVLDDAPIMPVALECEYMVNFGISPLEAIGCATANGARVLGMSDRFGTIADGLAADLLLVDGDPSQDIKALTSVRAVFKDGKAV